MPTIVLLDDTPEIFDLYRLLLRDLAPGAKIRSFTLGLHAWHCLNALPADLLITDLNHPSPDGLQLLDRLAAADIQVPVLVVSMMPLRQQAEARSLPLRPVIFLSLPFTVAQFNQAVRKLLGPENAS